MTAPQPNFKVIGTSLGAMFCLAVQAVAIFLVRQNPDHLQNAGYGFALPILFFLIPYMASRSTGKFVLVVVCSFLILCLGSIAFTVYVYLESFTLKLPSAELAIAVVALLLSAVLGSLTGFLVFQRAMKMDTDQAEGGNGA